MADVENVQTAGEVGEHFDNDQASRNATTRRHLAKVSFLLVVGFVVLSSGPSTPSAAQVSMDVTTLKDARQLSSNVATSASGDYDGLTDKGTSQIHVFNAPGYLEDPECIGGWCFGNYRNATVSGYKFHDENADSKWDKFFDKADNKWDNSAAGSEEGLKGWTIIASGTDAKGNQIRRENTTDATGLWVISALPPGKYTFFESLKPIGVEYSLPIGVDLEEWHQSLPHRGFYEVTLGSGDNLQSSDQDEPLLFGNYMLTKIKITKYNDLNGNGRRELTVANERDEPGLPGWTMHVGGTDGQGMTVNRSCLTGDGLAGDGLLPGQCVVDKLVPGLYTIKEEPLRGWIQSEPTLGGTVSRKMESKLPTPDVPEALFGNFRLSRFIGLKYHDLNANGVRDASEPGLANWEITLSGVTGEGFTLTRTAWTRADGSFMLMGVPPGAYNVTEGKRIGWNQSQPATVASENPFLLKDHDYPLTVAGDTPVNDGSCLPPVSLGIGCPFVFGNFRPVCPMIRKFEDKNANGYRNKDDELLKGWTINVEGTNGFGRAVSLSAQTGDKGEHSFELVPGNYQIRESFDKTVWNQATPGYQPGQVYNVTFLSGQQRCYPLHEVLCAAAHAGCNTATLCDVTGIVPGMEVAIAGELKMVVSIEQGVQATCGESTTASPTDSGEGEGSGRRLETQTGTEGFLTFDSDLEHEVPTTTDIEVVSPPTPQTPTLPPVHQEQLAGVTAAPVAGAGAVPVLAWVLIAIGVIGLIACVVYFMFFHDTGEKKKKKQNEKRGLTKGPSNEEEARDQKAGTTQQAPLPVADTSYTPLPLVHELYAAAPVFTNYAPLPVVDTSYTAMPLVHAMPQQPVYHQGPTTHTMVAPQMAVHPQHPAFYPNHMQPQVMYPPTAGR